MFPSHSPSLIYVDNIILPDKFANGVIVIEQRCEKYFQKKRRFGFGRISCPKDVDNDYIAEVSTKKNMLHNEDIARMIVEEGSEIKYDTLQSVINQHDRISGHLCSGASACRYRRVVLRCVC